MRRSLLRLAGIVSVLAVAWLLFYTLEPRRTAYSCRTVWSCIGLGGRHSYSRDYVWVDQKPTESEEILRDGTVRFSREVSGARPDTLVLVLNKDGNSWSSDFRSSQRTAYDFIDLLASTKLNASIISLAMLTADHAEMESMKAASKRLPFAKVAISFIHDDSGVPYAGRHDPSVQLARRGELAKLRNQLMLSALHDEKHILWLDADVVELSPGIVQTMLRHSDNNDAAGIITALCHQNQMDNYDKNAWKVNSLTLSGTVALSERENAVRQLVSERLMVPEIINGTMDDQLMPLDSVGGTILFMRADLVRQGLTFPHKNVVGTTWGHAGWIGVETEGLCYAARGLKGGECFVLGGRHHARHTDWG
jgi:hypothetical protein